MADDVPFSNSVNAARGFSRLPILRQFGLLLGLSASIALGFAVVLWSKAPNYRPLFNHLSPQETSDVLDSLQMSGIEYKVDHGTGTVLVPADKLYDARFRLAGEGLPLGAASGFENLDKDSGFGTSRFMENARYRHALEGELSRTISNLQNIRSARVHLAIPKESVFINDKQDATASVFVDLKSGSHLTKKQVSAIVQMVASSVQNMKPASVTVVDQHGQLLSSSTAADEHLAKSQDQFEYQKQVEENYVKRIEALLTPLLGPGKVRARVSADIDFTHHERTQESYDPQYKAVRSEQIINEEKQGNKGAAGVPGALADNAPATNQDAGADQAAGEAKPGLAKQQAIRNYELGKTISFSQEPLGRIKHISAAVVVDNMQQAGADGKKGQAVPLTKAQMDKITDLIKNAMGFNEQRGDSLSVVNIPFAPQEAVEPMEALPIWKQAWLWNIVKPTVGGLFLLLLVFFVLRPVLKHLASKAVPETPVGGEYIAGQPGMMMSNGQMGHPGMPMQVSPEQSWDNFKNMAENDPKRIAQVMKTWVGEGS